MNPYDYFIHQLNSPSWHWQIVWYFFLAGIAAGTYITSAISQLAGGKSDYHGAARGYMFGLPITLVCGFLLTIDLEMPSRFLHMVWYFPENVPMFKAHSPMSVGGWALGLFGAFSALGFLYGLVKMEKIKQPFLVKVANFFHEGPLSKVVLVIGILTAFYLATYTGVLTNTTQLPGWTQTSITPVLFLASGMSTGIAILVLATLRKHDLHEYKHKLERADLYMMLLELVVLIAFVISLGTWAAKVATGFYGVLLWGGVVGIGLLFPILLKWKPNLLGQRTTAIGCLLIIFGGYLLRYVVIMGPQAGYHGF